MYSLKSYSEQCYNIGSPLPSPARSPFKELPPNKESDFDFSPPKTKNIKAAKRKLDSDSDFKMPNLEASPKKVRTMDKDERQEMMNFLAEQSRINAENMANSIKATLETRMDKINNSLQIGLTVFL